MNRLRKLKQWVARSLPARPASLRPQPAQPSRRPSIRQEVVSLSWPIAVAMLGETAMGLVDTGLVSGLGPAAIGGVGMAVTLMFLCYSVVFGIMRGVKVNCAHAIGQDHPSFATRFAQAGLALGLACGLLVWFLSRDASWALRVLHIDPLLIVPARQFLAARTFAAPLTYALSALVQWRQGIGDSRTPMIVTLAGNAINAALAFALIHGLFGLPKMGVAGAGYATALAESLEALTLGLLLLRASRSLGQIPLSMCSAAWKIVGLGGPTGLQFGVETAAFTAFTAILGSLGALELASHQIALATIRVSFLPGLAIAEAACVLVGRALGRRNLAEADSTVKTALVLAISFMSCCGLVFATCGHRIASVFSNDSIVVDKVTQLLWLAAIFQLLDAVNIVLRGSLRGAKDVRVVAAIGILVVWICVPGFAYWLGLVHSMGVRGGWLGFIAETCLLATKRGKGWRTALEAGSRNVQQQGRLLRSSSGWSGSLLPCAWPLGSARLCLLLVLA